MAKKTGSSKKSKSTTKKSAEKKTAKKSTSGNAADSKKKTTKKKTAAATEAKKGSSAKKTTTSKKTRAKKPTLQTLLRQSFDWNPPKSVHVGTPEETDPGLFTAPDFFVDADEKEKKRVMSLILQKIEVPKGGKDPMKTEKTPPAVKPEKVDKKKEKTSPPPVSELLKKRFDGKVPDKLYQPESGKAQEAEYTAPPAVDAADETEGKRLRSLLLQRIDLADVSPEKPAPPAAEPEGELEAAEPEAPPAPPAEPPPLSVLLMRKFAAEAPTDVYRPEPADTAGGDYTAPPAVDAADETEAKRLRSLLLQRIDLADVSPEKPAAEISPPEPEPAPQPEAPPSTPPEAPPPEPEPAPQPEAPPSTPPSPQPETPTPEPSPEPGSTKSVEEKPKPKADAKAEPTEKQKPTPAAPDLPVQVRYEAPEEAEEPPPAAPEPKQQEPRVPPDPVDRSLQWMVAVLAVLFGLILWSSIANVDNVYVKPVKDGTVEIYKGDFSPTGIRKLGTIDSRYLPAQVKPEAGKDFKETVYSTKTLYPALVSYYMDRADTLLTETGLPDFDKVRVVLDKAYTYCLTLPQKLEVMDQYRKIDFMVLINKAVVAESRGTREGYHQALAYLQEAKEVPNLEKRLTRMAEQKIETLKQTISEGGS